MENNEMNVTVQNEAAENASPVFSGGGAPVNGQMQMGAQPAGKAPEMSVGKRIGYGFLSWAPFAACMALQFGIAIVVMLCAVVVEVLKVGPEIMSDMDAYMQLVYDVIAESAYLGTVGYHIVGTLVFAIWYYFSYRKPRPKVFGAFKKLTWKNVLIAVVCGIALCFFSNGTVFVEYVLVPDVVEAYIEMAEMAGLGTEPIVIFAAIILAPIGEEFVCRGLTQKYAKKAIGKFWLANIFQAFVFGLMHLNWVQGIYAFVIGLVLGWLVERYDSILLAMLVHFVVNLSTSTWVDKVLDPLYKVFPYDLPFGIILMVLSGAITVGMLIWGGKKEQTA